MYKNSDEYGVKIGCFKSNFCNYVYVMYGFGVRTRKQVYIDRLEALNVRIRGTSNHRKDAE